MATEKELQRATGMMGKIEIPPWLEGRLTKVVNEDGSVTISDSITGKQTTVTKENAVEAIKRRQP